MLVEKSEEITPETMKRWSQSKKQPPVVGVIGDGSKVQCCNCIGTWNVRSMNQGKLKVIKQKMARVNIYIFDQRTKMDWKRQI